MRVSHALAIAACCLFLLALAPPAQAMDCNQCTGCDTCDTYCEVCVEYDMYGCALSMPSTCGEQGLCEGTCCTPDFQEISREVQGTYGEGYGLFCEHHVVEWVTQYDFNQCSPNPANWYSYYCHDETDGYKFGIDPDCCDDTPAGYGFTCNHYHHCTG